MNKNPIGYGQGHGSGEYEGHQDPSGSDVNYELVCNTLTTRAGESIEDACGESPPPLALGDLAHSENRGVGCDVDVKMKLSK